jgi:CRISPR-associated protein (TIGR03984 family)
VVLADLEYNLDETLRLSCLSVTTHQKQTYLLWGEGLGPVADLTAGLWSRLATARIGSLDVPLPNLSHGERVRLRALEYFATYEDGNVGVLDERLLGLEVDRG